MRYKKAYLQAFSDRIVYNSTRLKSKRQNRHGRVIMKTTRKFESNPILSKSSAAMLVTAILLLVSANSQAYDKYQYEVLLNPSADILHAESRGRIMIYDGLENDVVEQAMSEQFDRIESMMFVRTRYVQPDGDIDVEEDGCD